MPFEITEQIQRHLDDDRTVLLTTVTPTNRPAPRPVWFLWDGSKFVVFSRPNTAKLRHIAVNPNVALGNGIGARGADTIVISGTAQIVPDAPSAAEIPAYVERYDSLITRLGMDPEKFAATYSVPIHIAPSKAWAIP